MRFHDSSQHPEVLVAKSTLACSLAKHPRVLLETCTLVCLAAQEFSMRRYSPIRLLAPLVLFAAAMAAPAAQDVTVPNAKDSLKFAIIGDSGTGDSAQFKVAEKLVAIHGKFPYEFVLMMGDNLYGGSDAKDFRKKFETPYKPLLDSGMKFYATLGNHDNPNEHFYQSWNMKGERFYTFKPKPG